MNDALAGVLLTNGDYYGTLAAARYFGRKGYRVAVADNGRAAASHYSRFVQERLQCPPRLEFDARLRWLIDFGKARPGWLLYPCSDDMAWIIAGGRERLAPHFAMFQPSFTTIETLLNKQKLYGLCARLGVPTPFTTYPTNLHELTDIAQSLEGRYLVKPKTQVGLTITRKATLSEGGADLITAYTRFQSAFRHIEAVCRHDPTLAWPMIQAFNPSAATQTSNLAGFRSRDGQTFRFLSSRKALQYPLTIGVGLCFESIPAPPVLVDYVRRICEATDYFGAFEVEFIRSGDGFDLIDFNPRYYGQMALEIGRGLPIPGMVAAAALDLPPVPVEETVVDMHIAHRSLLKLIMTTQWIARRVSLRERNRWLRLTSGKESRMVDHVYAADDKCPWLADILLRWLGYLRHPRSSLRTLFGAE